MKPCSKSTLAAALAALVLCCGCGSGGPVPAWTCKNYGPGRRCAAAFVPPGPQTWDCYVALGTLACMGEGAAKGGAGWKCSRRGASTLCIAPGAAVPDEPSPDGWQCFVEKKRIVCDWRREGNDSWKCQGQQCTERLPDFPGPDEWECIEEGWGVLCRGRFLHEIHPRWSCSEYKDRFLCMDPDPDYPPPGGPEAWKCHYDNSLKTGRICSAAKTDPCTRCPGQCLEGRCFPATRTPGCYFDFDCAPGEKCRLGTCVKP